MEELRRRFEFLDHHVIPYCWWRHNGHVEALAALRDHERVSFTELAPATAPLDWLRALRDTAAVLRSWTADLACGSVHQEPTPHSPPFDQDEWHGHVDADLAARHRARNRCSASAPSRGGWLQPRRRDEGETREDARCTRSLSFLNSFICAAGTTLWWNSSAFGQLALYRGRSIADIGPLHHFLSATPWRVGRGRTGRHHGRRPPAGRRPGPG